MLTDAQKQVILKYRPKRYGFARLARLINATEQDVLAFVDSLPKKAVRDGVQPKRVPDPTPAEIAERKAIARAMRCGPLTDDAY